MRTDNQYQSEFARKYVAQGRVEGREEGREEGVLAGKAETLLSVLVARGVKVAAGEASVIRRCVDERQLDRWVKQALKVESASELFASARKPSRATASRRH